MMLIWINYAMVREFELINIIIIIADYKQGEMKVNNHKYVNRWMIFTKNIH